MVPVAQAPGRGPCGPGPVRRTHPRSGPRRTRCPRGQRAVSQEQFDDVGLRARQPKAVQSALAVLEEVARCGPGGTGMEVSRNLGLPKATTYRLLNLLVEDEYLVRMPDLSGFALGRKVEMLVRLAADARPLQ
ncbi:helix-turn-helix domain-containing protein, partial [Arthrobacter deserti]|nr:helix-turn-helix domain-containing protein [Arthrobacter deserti]